MKEEIQVNLDALDQQAKLHQQFSTAFQDVITTFNMHHDTVLGLLPTDHAESYRQWWEGFRDYLQKNADLHDQLGIYLQKAKEAYITNEQDIGTSFTPQNPS